jgi:hypothetical protein
MDGSRYISLRLTASGSAGSLLAAHFFREKAVDPLLGEYWAKRESPELYETQRRSWNEKANNDPSRSHNLRILTTGPDPQLRMAELRADKEPAIGVASPFENPDYIATGTGVPNLDIGKLKLNPVTRRAMQVNSLAAHDWRQIDSAIWVSKEILDSTREISKAWLEIHSLLKKSPALTDSAEAKEAGNRVRDYAKRNPNYPEAQMSMEGFTPEGAYWWRMAEIELYRTQRGFHSFDHLLIQLMRDDLPNDIQITNEGPLHQREVDLHRWGLGQSGGNPPLHASPLLQVTYEEAHDASPLTLTKAIKRITEEERRRLAAFGKRVPDAQVKSFIERYLKAHPSRSDGEIERMARNQRERWRDLGLTSGW